MIGLFKPPTPLTTPEAVRDEIRDRLAKTGRITSVQPKGTDGLEVTADGKTHQFFLEDAVVAVLGHDASPRGQHKTVKSFVSALLSSLDHHPIDLDRVYPIVRHIDDVVVDEVQAIFTPMPGDLVCAPAMDTPLNLIMLTKDRVEADNLAMAEVWGAARVNLSVALGGVQTDLLGRGMHMLRLERPWMGASILLAPNVLQSAREELGAEMIYIAAPSRDGVTIIDSAAPHAFEQIQTTVEIGLRQDHPQSTYIYTLTANDRTPVPGWRCEDGLFLTAS